ncbi:MAG: hypothetical protein KC468_21225, partial [Myxococcales bacterium]|nr:hypothetical protein [Myxococcales bacterium]
MSTNDVRDPGDIRAVAIRARRAGRTLAALDGRGRAGVLSALADAPSRLRAPLVARDTRLMVEALRGLGARIDEIDGAGGFGPDLAIGPALLAEPASVDCGLAGTV